MMESDNSRKMMVLGGLFGAFNREMGADTVAAYVAGLSDISPERVERAVAHALRGCTYMPAVAELRQYAGEQSAETKALEAWLLVAETATRVGAYGSVDFVDQVINATVRAMGGWPSLCRKSADDFWVWSRKEFERVYLAQSLIVLDAERCAYLPGDHEAANTLTGAEPPRPKRIESPQECKRLETA